MRKYYKDYNKEELTNKINSLNIVREGNLVITKFNDRIIKTSNVSDKYEVFDIKSYLKSKLESIEQNFNISKYEFLIKGGIQSLNLISDPVVINNVTFYKSFYILNSTDRSRRLSFYAGLYSEEKEFYIINSIENIGLSKKHLKGVTEAAEEATFGLNDETFNEQIKNIESLVGHRISFSKLKEIVVDDDTVKINHKKFDAFKSNILFYQREGQLKLTQEQIKVLRTPSEKLKIEESKDFYIDAFWAFQTYLRVFSNQDSHIIRKETEKIMSITQWSIRNQQLELLGI